MLNLGYLGGVYDAGTGLIYMGNGQYYDPSTGRFLTRGAQQDQSNPYTPWNSDPAGMLIAPLALLALVFGRKKTRTKFDQFVILFVIVLSVGLSVSACNATTDQFNIETAIVEVETFIASTATEGYYATARVKLTDAAGVTVTATITIEPSDTPTPDNTSTATLESTCTETPTPTQTGTVWPAPSITGLSNEKGTYGYDAVDVYNLYTVYRDYIKGLNNPKINHELTIQEFFGLMIYKDGLSAGALYKLDYPRDKIEWAVTVQLYSGIRGRNYCNNDQCEAGLFNYLAINIESCMKEVHNIYSGHNPNLDFETPLEDVLDNSDTLTDHILSPTDASRKEYSGNVPIYWGNVPLDSLYWLGIFYYKEPTTGSSYDQIYYLDRSGFVIVSDFQREYWKGLCDADREKCNTGYSKLFLE